ncbi:MAG TPA: hypothetical protein VMZ00_05250, partial [Sporichthya sp.]|nr:hypothetical protein [Sporichthya sp.]
MTVLGEDALSLTADLPPARPARPAPQPVPAEHPLPNAALVLTGFTVAITACRRREELAGLLERRGAR